jgi:hypothetical protein
LALLQNIDGTKIRDTVEPAEENNIGDPLKGPAGVFAKFVAAALFGGMLSIAIFFVVVLIDIEAVWDRPWFHLRWMVPLVWGVRGIFWFERMLDIARDIIEGIFGLEKCLACHFCKPPLSHVGCMRGIL